MSAAEKHVETRIAHHHTFDGLSTQARSVLRRGLTVVLNNSKSDEAFNEATALVAALDGDSAVFAKTRLDETSSDEIEEGRLPFNRYDLQMVLDGQQSKLFTAESIVESVREALRAHFGRDWPASIPDYPRALNEAVRLIRSAYGNLDVGEIENTLAEFNQAPDPDETELAERIAALRQ